MNFYRKLMICVLLCTGFVCVEASAAVTCVLNKQTGKFEEKTNGKRATGECEAQNALNLIGSAGDAEAAVNSEGTKIINGVVVTNAASVGDAMAGDGAAAKTKAVPATSKRELTCVFNKTTARFEAVPPGDGGNGACADMNKLIGAADEEKAAVVPVMSGMTQGGAVDRGVKAVEAAKPVEAPKPPPPPPTWIKATGASLRGVVNEWSAKAGWEVAWMVKDEQTGEDIDYELGGGLKIVGSYKDAITGLFNSLPENVKVRTEFWGDNNPPLLYVIKGEAQ